MKYLTSDDYPSSCNSCKRAIDTAYQLIVDGLVGDEYSDDNEGHCMLAYDRGWLSHDSECCN